MATADQYAAWIVQNQAKRGTPEFNTVAQAYQQAKAEESQNVPSAGFSLADTGRAAQQGLYGGLQSLTDLFGAGNAVSRDLSALQQEAAAKMSEERKAEIARRELLKKKAEGNTWEEIKATVGGFTEAPLQTTIGALTGSAPIIASAFIPGGQPAAVAGLTGRAALGARALAAAKSPAAGVGALMGVGGQKGQDYEAVKQALLAKNYSEAEAERLAQEVSGYSLENAPRQLAAGLVGGLEGVTGIERLLGRAGRLGKAAPAEKAVGLPEPTFGQALRQGVVSEALPEALQASTGQVGTNIALNQAGIPTDLLQGVAAQAINDALVGGTLGAGFSPLKMRELRQEFVNDEMARKREEDEKIAQGRRDAAAQRQKTKQQFVGDQPLLLPAPSQELEPVKELAPLQNPIGNLTPDELGPEVSSYLNQYRKANGLPRLQSYSIEDVKDAMTAINPEGEKAALDSILAAKTGYTGQQNFTAKDVENAAIEKNVATGTKGFSDFLARTTGVNNLQEMSEPQLYAAFKALSDMPANTTGQQTVLPEGTNASRFTQKQYDSAVKYVGLTFDENNGKPLSTETILADIKDSTNLATDRDAKALLDTAIKNGDLEQSQQVVYRTFKPDNDQMVATYPTRERAEAAAKKQGLNVREATLTQVAPKAPVTPPTAPRAGLPAGYDITERQFKEGEEPEGYQITSEAGGKPFPTILNQAEVEGKIAQLSADRQEIASTKLQEIMKYEDTVNQGKRELEKLEAAGEFDTDNYKQKKARQAAKEDLLGKRIDALYKEIEGLTAPLKSKAVGSKPIARKGFTVTKEGKESGTFPTREAAEESILAGLSDEALDALVSDKKFGGLANRAAAEQNRRRSAPATTGKKVSEVLKDLESGPPIEETPELLAKTKPLRDMLNRFGLGDVALKIVKAIENKADGSYAGKVIELALDAKNPIRTLRHESLHALKELGFFTDAQWKSLEKMARDKWISKYLEGSKAVLQDGTTGTRLQAYKELGLTEADIIEEAIADAFGDFDVNKAPPGMLTALLNKLRGFFESLNNYLAGRGFENSQDIFGAVEKGQLKAGQAQADGKKLSVQAPEEGETVKKVDPKDVSNIVKNSPYKDAGINVLSSQIEETSKPLKVDEVGKLFDDAYMAEFGKQGDWRNPTDFKRAVVQAVDELKFQMQQAKSGQDWYDEDVALAFSETEKIIPSLADPQKRAFFSVLAGIMSPSTNARENWVIAAEAYQHYEKTGTVPGRNPANGNLWMGGLTSATKEKQLNMLNKMMQPVSQGGLGEKATIEWMQSAHTVKEINDMRRKYGNMGGVDGKLGDLKLGFTAFGPKVGPFVMNINGIHEVTVDVWMTRTFNRYFGQMMGPDGKMIEAPTEPQRVAVKNLAINVAQQLNLKPYQVQSMLWFYEQQLFNKLGTGAKSYGFSDGAKKFVETQSTGGGKGPSPTGGGNAPANRPAGQRKGQASATAGKQPTGKPKKLSLGVVAEVAPNPDQPSAEMWRQMSAAERLNATQAVARKVMNGIFDELGLKGYTFKFSTGTYEGESNPNIIVDAPQDATVEDLNELARVMGYALDQKAMVVFDDENTQTDNQEGYVVVKVPENMGAEAFEAFREHIGRSVPQVEGDTLRDGKLFFGNFSAYNDNIDTVSDAEYHKAIVQAVESFDYDGDIEVYAPRRFHSELIWPKNRQEYLTGTRYGESDTQAVPAGGTGLRGVGRSRLQTISDDAIALRDRWIDARGAARLGGRSQPNAASYEDPTAEYGVATPDSTQVTGVHFSKQPRATISSAFYGAGLRGLEAERLNDATNSDIKSRVYFYVDTGQGIRPEAGVGGAPHVIQLNNLYDVQKDPLQIVKGVRGTTAEERANRLERGIMNAGFDGYVTRDPIMNQGFAVLIGKHNIKTDKKFSLREAPDTPEFKQFFKRSGFINSAGQPMMMYHATDADITEFRSSEDGKLGAGIYLSSVPQYVNQYAPEGNVMPLYASAQNPFILNISDVAFKSLSDSRRPFGTGIDKQMEAAVALLTDGKKRLKDLTGQQVQNLFKRNGYDGIMARDDAGNIIEATVFKPEQVKSATGNVGTYSPKSKDVRYSVRSVEDTIKAMPNGDKIHQAVAMKTTVREEKSIARRILDAFAGESIAALRQQALNRYNQLSVYDKMLADKMGGKALLADSSAEAAALLSDTASGVAAAAFGVNNVGGAPVYRNGVTVVDNFDGKVKGLMDILMPLAEMKDPFAYRAFQFYAASKRGSRFEADGKEKPFDKDDFAYAAQLEAEYPAFKQVHADWIAYNDKLVDYMVATGVISKDKAKEFTKYADYIPFYRQLEGQDTIGPKVFQSISGVKAPKKLKGDSDAPIADFMETMVRNTQSIIQAGMKNTAGQKAIDVALQLDMAEKLDKQSSAPGTVTIMRDGEYVSYAVGDELFINSVKSLNMPDVKLWGIFAGPSNLLRNMVTKDPGFMLANLLRDSMSAYVTSGVKMTPVADTVANFGRALGGTDPTYQALVKAGILGGYDYAQGVERSGSQLAADLRKRTGSQTLSEKALDGFGLWSTLEKGTSASDAATRMAVYNQVLEDTGNEAEAIFRALEVMNFNRKGASPIVRLLTAAIPFLNARMQGLDVFYRAGIQPFLDKSPTDRAKAVQKAFFVRGMYMTSLSIAYWAMVHDDDDYLAQEQETRDNNWLIPSMGVKIPIPFEVGVLFKVIPERIMGYTMGDDTGKDFAESMGRAAWSTFGFLPVPQTALPLLEAATNYSFYTGRNIVGAGMEGVEPEFQKGPGTSKVASFLGEQIGASPMKVDHIIKGYTGTIGTYMVDVMDSIGDLNSESPKAAKRFEQMPVLKRFAVDPEAKGTVTAYYKLKEAVDETVRTINLLEKTGRVEELSAYAEENAKLFGTRGYISSLEKQMKVLRDASLQINNSGMSATEKRDALSAINQAQINMTRHIQGIKKIVSE
jgi:hypothetical protein